MTSTLPPYAGLSWRPVALVIALLAGPVPALAQGPPACEPRGSGPEAEAVDSVFAEWDRTDGPGAAVAVLRDGEIVLERGYGRAHLEYDVPVGPCTVFHVASVTKQFIAFGVALLAEEGALSLDDDLRDHLPWLPDVGRKITLRQLIHHTSGLRDQWQLLALGGWRLDDVITQEQILSAVARQRDLNFDPGTRHMYSNTGYTLLAEVVERASGRPFPDWMQERVFRPLGMERTHLHVDHEHLVPGRAYAYQRPDTADVWRKSVLSYATAGATSLFTTTGDLARWLRNFETGEVGGPAVLERMHERGVLASGDTLDYAFGISRGKHRGRVTWSHSGGDAGFRSHVLRLPGERLAVAVAGNAASVRPARLARQVADVYLGVADAGRADEARRDSPSPVRLAGAVLDSLAGRYELEGVGVLEVRRDDGHLALSAGGPGIELLPVSDSLFRARDRELTVAFVRDDRGAVTGLRVETPSGRRAGERLPEPDLSSAELAAYAGDYLSSELRVLYRVEVASAGLRLAHPKHGEIRLEPAGEDAFTTDRWFLPKVVFTRDGDGRITGFEVSGGRVVGLRFDRMESGSR